MEPLCDTSRRRRRLLLPALVASLQIAAPTLGSAAMADPFAGLAPLDSAELGTLRGGMMIGGIPVDFAVVIRTTVTGAMAPLGLETTVAVADNGQAGATSSQATGGIATSDAQGLTMVMGDGGTSILHQVMKSDVQALISNTTDNVSISHSTEVNVTMPGLDQLVQNHYTQTHVSRLGSDSAVVGLGRF